MGKKVEEIVDTNVIIRFLVGDDAAQQKKARLWFREANEGKRTLLIKPLVIAEVCFVLEFFYKQNRTDIAAVLEVFLSQKWLVVESRDVMLYLWSWYRNNNYFVDSFLLSWARVNKGNILSFDKKILGQLQ